MSFDNILLQANLLNIQIKGDLNEMITKGYLYLEDIISCLNEINPPVKRINLPETSNSLESTISTGKRQNSINQINKDSLPIQIMKNNKVVFAKASQHNGKKNAQRKTILAINRGKRGSKYRGVSKNGNQWQVLIMVKKGKNYFGSYDTEDHAARVYDLVAIQNYEEKAKTNYCYSKEEIMRIKKIDFEDKIAVEQYYCSV